MQGRNDRETWTILKTTADTRKRTVSTFHKVYYLSTKG